MGQIQIACTYLIEKSEGKTLIVIPRRRSEDNIKIGFDKYVLKTLGAFVRRTQCHVALRSKL
jgi:hypothetical protein